MMYRIQVIATKNGKGTFALVDVCSGITYRMVGTTRTYWTASRNTRARSHAHTLAKRHYAANKVPHITGPFRVEVC